MANIIEEQAKLLKLMIKDADHPQMWSHTYDAKDAVNYAEKFLAYFKLDFVKMYQFANDEFYLPDQLNSMDVNVFQNIFFEFMRRNIVNYIESINIDTYDEDFDELDNILKIGIDGYNQFYAFENAMDNPEDLMDALTKYIVSLYSKTDKYVVRADFEGFLIDGFEIKYDDLSTIIKNQIIKQGISDGK